MSSASATATAAPAQAQPSQWRPGLAAPKAVGLLCLASLWVGFAAAGAAAVALVAACDYDEACPVLRVLGAATTRALIFAAALALIAPLLVVRAAFCDGRFRLVLVVNLVMYRQAPQVPAGSMLREAVVRAFLAVFVFVLLGVIGCIVLVGLSPAKGSRTGWIGAMLVVVGEVGSMAICCFIIVPLLALKIWRIKLLPVEISGSNV
ncbi:hypothetical protein HU200_005206 [Digitaria exilis]|uniref:Uncharacterized protein n=1 Tax=Digitaria exilis TaxID=1010633 RepID=A0A835FU78_9POAL|nr:hypothetical protein HU200_005206 [Digitaria exilis]